MYAKLIELPFRNTLFNKSLKVIFNGEENDYPDRIARLVPNSITTKQCAKLFRQYLTGKGFEGINKKLVNSKKKIKFFSFFNRYNGQYATHNGVAVHVQYRLELKDGESMAVKDRFEVIPFEAVRKGQKDDRDYNGKFAMSKKRNFLKGVKKGDLIWCYAYNSNSDVVKKQIEDSGGIGKYPGQIYFFNPEEGDYPLAHIHSVMNDADSEMRSSVFKNKSLRKGFFGKNILVTTPMIDPDLSTRDITNLKDEEAADLLHQKKERKDFYESAKGFVGVENHEGLMIMEVEHEGDIDKVFKHIEIPTNINDKLFAYTESSVSNNIRKAYNNCPRILVDNAEVKGVFGDSGKMLVEAKKYFQDQTEEDRMLIFEAMEELFDGFDGIDFDSTKFLPLVDATKPKKQEDGNNNA